MNSLDDYSNHYALLIGTGTDLDGGYSARYQSTINDAKWLATILNECRFPPENVKLLTKTNATKANIVVEFGKIKDSIATSKKAPERLCTVVVFFSGYCRTKDDNEAILISYGYSKPYNFTDNGIDGQFLVDQINLLCADKVLVVLNTLHTDTDTDTEAVMRRPLSEDQLKLLRSNGEVAVLSVTQASENAQTVYEVNGTSQRYSPFTISFGRALSGVGKPEDTNLILSSDVLDQSIVIVKYLTEKQQQVFHYQTGNFPVGRYRVPRENKILFLGNEDEIVVDIGESKEQENLATTATAARTAPSSVLVYNGTVTAKQSSLGVPRNISDGTISYNWTKHEFSYEEM